MECKPIAEKNRAYIGVKCTKEETDDLRLIIIKIQCASACLSPANIPPDCDNEKAKLFIEKAIEVQANTRWLEEDWWLRMKVKYVLPTGCFIDFEKQEFYTKKE